MTKVIDEGPRRRSPGSRASAVRAGSAEEEVLSEYDATALIGLRVLVRNAAIKRPAEKGDYDVEIPLLRELAAASAVARCMMSLRLRGFEIKSIRKIMDLTMKELAKKLDERAAAETIARWESEAQPMGVYAEKVFRLIVCETLKSDAIATGYKAEKIAGLRVVDPNRASGAFETPYIVMHRQKVVDFQGNVIDAWEREAA